MSGADDALTPRQRRFAPAQQKMPLTSTADVTLLYQLEAAMSQR